VIIGGGMGGLCFAAALHRVGLKPVVLEQSDRLRSEGTSITLWNNAMKVLELVDVADLLRNTYVNVLGVEYLNYLGRRLTILDYSTCEGGPHEMRCVERKVLLDALAAQIPKGTIRLNSRVTSIKKSETSPNYTDLELQDGSTYSAKVVVGFDGVNSIVGSWLGLKKPNSVGQLEIRGMAEFPNAHNFSNLFRIFYGKQIVIGFNSMTPTKVFWLVVWTDWSEGWRNTTPEQIKQEALERAKDFQVPELELCINNTALEHFTKNTIRHRINEKPTCETQVVGNVTVCGDASHPTTPNLGQGGCMALEDGIILARKLHQTLKSKESQTSNVPEHERIHQTLLDFHRERYPRTNALARKAAMVGSSVNADTFIKRFLRDWFFIPRGVHGGNYMEDTLFDVGKLPIDKP
jgi:2-polyprenyl-6-methoxyphenol hydroxylase-like FAD-dependent oxidoreductase